MFLTMGCQKHENMEQYDVSIKNCLKGCLNNFKYDRHVCYTKSHELDNIQESEKYESICLPETQKNYDDCTLVCKEKPKYNI